MDKNLQENMPIYVQIMNKVRESIASGELAPKNCICCPIWIADTQHAME